MSRVLIIEDDSALRKIYKAAFKDAPYEVVTEASGVRGVELVKEGLAANNGFDLIVTDFVLTNDLERKVTGIDVARQIRELCSFCKIVMATGRADLIDDADARRLGLKGVWVKPFEKNIRNAVDEMLNVPKVETASKKPNLFRRTSNADVRPSSVMLMALWVAVLMSLLLNAFSAWRAPRLYDRIDAISRKLDGAVSTHALPVGYRVTVDRSKADYQVMADGSVRVRFHFEKKDALAAQSLAAERDAPLYLNVTRAKDE